MMEKSKINPFSLVQLRWLLIVGLVQALFATPLYPDQTHTLSPVNMPMATMIHPVGLLKMPRDIETKKSTPSLRGVKKERLFRPIILQASNRYQVDPAIIQAIIMAESSYNPKAVSRRGAKGLMQLMPRTARALGVKDSFNPEHNINGGVKYFKQLLNQFDGDLKLALAAYNAGSRKVRRYKGVPPFKATHRYIKKVFEYHRYYRGLMIRNG